jgi:23S rRNA (guanine2445-N2)-methyltransferase / 23S rRNA (guanine2069-N7)-methyltransferase
VHSLLVTAARGLVPLVEAELLALGAKTVRPTPAGLRVRGPLEFAYRVCMWSRCASRVIVHLQDAAIDGPEALYVAARAIAWEDHLGPDDTLAVDAVVHGDVVTHSRYAAQRIKDGVVDRMRDLFGRRPSVDLEAPSVRIHADVRGRGVDFGIDLSGQPLHRRAWRHAQGIAPLKETLAAGLLLRADWPARVVADEPLLDPLCGAGTIAIEAACIAYDLAPGRLRARWGFDGWRGHDLDAWTRVRDDADARAHVGLGRSGPTIEASDLDNEAVARARANAMHAGVLERIAFAVRPVESLPKPTAQRGLVVTNPPYGARLGDEAEVRRLYAALGDVLRTRFVGWDVQLLVAADAPVELLGLQATRDDAIDNGPIPCRMLGATLGAAVPSRVAATDGGMFANRLRKNLRRLGPIAAREKVGCFRVYDAEIPEYNAAIDRYESFVHLQEFSAPRHIDPTLAAARVQEMVDAVVGQLGVAREQVFVKRRRPQRPGAQYGRFDKRGEFVPVHEDGHVFLVNPSDFLDTGLFLDTRPVRRMIAAASGPGRRMLNLFAYTGTASVVAAKAGAHTTSVDLSNTYLEWAQRNFTANGLDSRKHVFVRADAREWLDEDHGRFDVVLLDPPSFSTSKGMVGTFDVLRDHVAIVRAAARRLAPGGVLLFVTNRDGFVLDTSGLAAAAGPTDLDVQDITRASLPFDFAREPPAHRAWRITRKS